MILLIQLKLVRIWLNLDLLLSISLATFVLRHFVLCILITTSFLFNTVIGMKFVFKSFSTRKGCNLFPVIPLSLVMPSFLKNMLSLLIVVFVNEIIPSGIPSEFKLKIHSIFQFDSVFFSLMKPSLPRD